MAAHAHTSMELKAVSLSSRANRSGEKDGESSKVLPTGNALFRAVCYTPDLKKTS